MAKDHTTLSVLVDIASIVWFKDWNAARPSGDYGDTKDLRQSFKTHGWMLTGDGTIDVEVIPEDRKERALKERQAQLDALRAANKVNPSGTNLTLLTFEEIYCEKGKLKPILYIGDTGNRRSEAYFPAMVERKQENLPVTTQVPVVIKKFEDDLARLEAQILENEGKSIGFQEMSPTDKLRSAKRAVEFGANQSRLRKTFKDGTGQKLWAILTLNRRFPTLQIFDRMLLPPEDTSHIKPFAQSVSDMNQLILRSDPKELEEENRKLRVRGNELKKAATEEEVAEFFGKARSTVNEPKIMKRDKIQGVSTDFPATVVRNAMKAVMDNNTDRIAKYHSASAGYNSLDGLLDDGDYPRIELVLVKLLGVKGAEREAMFKRLHAALDTPAPANGPGGASPRERQTAGRG